MATRGDVLKVEPPRDWPDPPPPRHQVSDAPPAPGACSECGPEIPAAIWETERASLRTFKARLATKLTKILDDIEDAPKTGRNKDQGYDYQSAKDIVSVTRRVMAKHGVFLKWVPDPQIKWREYMSKSNNLQREATIWYAAVFMDAETGYEEVIPWPGVGVDAQDKSLAKAATAAMKSFLATQFQIGDGSSDNDRGESEDGSRSRGASRADRQQPQRVENVWPKKISGMLQKTEAHQDGSYVFVKGARFWARNTDIELKLAGATGKLIEFEADMGKGPDGLLCPTILKLLAVPPSTAPKPPQEGPQAPAGARIATGEVVQGAPDPKSGTQAARTILSPHGTPGVASGSAPSNEGAKREVPHQPTREELFPRGGR
jgi:hypothetical protein